jgi:hypothetical protein
MQYCQKLTFVNFAQRSPTFDVGATVQEGAIQKESLLLFYIPPLLLKRLIFLHFKPLKLFSPACVERFALWPAAPFVRWPSDPFADGLAENPPSLWPENRLFKRA